MMWTHVLSTRVIEGAILNHSSETVNEKPLSPLHTGAGVTWEHKIHTTKESIGSCQENHAKPMLCCATYDGMPAPPPP